MSQPEVTAPAVGSDSGIASAASAAGGNEQLVSPYLEQSIGNRKTNRQQPRQIKFDDPYVGSVSRTNGTGEEQPGGSDSVIAPLTLGDGDPYSFYGDQTGDGCAACLGRKTALEESEITKNPEVAARLDEAKTIVVRTRGDAKDGDPAADVLVDESGKVTVNPSKALSADGAVVIEFARPVNGTGSAELQPTKDALRSMYDYLMLKSPYKVPSDWELLVVKDALDKTTELKFDKLTDENKKDADLIIDKDGNIKLNKDNPNAGADGQTLIVYELDNSAGEMVMAQKAAVRDLMKYFQLNNPGLGMPPEWVSIENQAVPPPRYVPKPIGGGGVGGGNLIGGGGSSGGGGGGGSIGGGGAGGTGGGGGGRITEGGTYSPDVSPVTGIDSNGQLGLTDSFVDRVVTAISGNEGNYTSINPNDAGYGISIGIRQWNQQAGELPTLLKAWDGQGLSESAQESLKKDGVDVSKLDGKFKEIFGPYADKLTDENWVRNANMAGDPDLMKRIETALGDKDFQAVQRALARDFVRSAAKLGYEYGFRTELGLALVADIANQKGFGGAESVLQGAGLQKNGQTLSNEADLIPRIAANSDRPGAMSRFQHLDGIFDAIAADINDQGTSTGADKMEAMGYVFPVAGFSAKSIGLHHGSGHGAADIFAPVGTPILAMRDGVVTNVGQNSLGGNTITIRFDNGLVGYHAHMSEPSHLREGQSVSKGDPIGKVGDTGNAKGTGAHLHMGLGYDIISGSGPNGGAGSGPNGQGVFAFNQLLNQILANA